MKLLITAATPEELLIAQQLAAVTPEACCCAVTGIGLVPTAYHTLKHLQAAHYDMAINIGIAGSFTDRLPVGSVCSVRKEYFGDCGIQTPKGFFTLFDEHLLSDNTFPFIDGALHATEKPTAHTAGIPAAIGVTVHTVSGDLQRISELQSRFSPDIETMESAAFFYVCLQEKIPFLALRAISNKVEPRDKSKWNIPLALQNLSNVLKNVFYNIF
ncbi:MAG: futalosine hydrolase [Prevotellaceae bacterium]|jgi:futalosine hydrolase|nr:futalosine hydrolase [Prevotellaceae bacterium]